MCMGGKSSTPAPTPKPVIVEKEVIVREPAQQHTSTLKPKPKTAQKAGGPKNRLFVNRENAQNASNVARYGERYHKDNAPRSMRFGDVGSTA